jgi:hypothetical protein
MLLGYSVVDIRPITFLVRFLNAVNGHCLCSEVTIEYVSTLKSVGGSGHLYKFKYSLPDELLISVCFSSLT